MADEVAKAFDFVDLQGRDRGYAIVRLGEPMADQPALIEFSLSLEHDGDVEVFVEADAAKQIAASISGGIDPAGSGAPAPELSFRNHGAFTSGVVSVAPIRGGLRVTVSIEGDRTVPFALPTAIARDIAAALLSAAAAADSRRPAGH